MIKSITPYTVKQYLQRTPFSEVQQDIKMLQGNKDSLLCFNYLDRPWLKYEKNSLIFWFVSSDGILGQKVLNMIYEEINKKSDPQDITDDFI